MNQPIENIMNAMTYALQAFALCVTLTTAMTLASAEDPKPAPKATPSDAAATPSLADQKTLFKNLHASCVSGDSKTWGPLLSKDKRAQGDEYIDKHYKVWCPFIIQVVKSKFDGDPSSPKVDFRIKTKVKASQVSYKIKVRDEAGKTVLPLKAVFEDGALRINEN